MINVIDREYFSDTQKIGDCLTKDMEACLRIGFTDEEIDTCLFNRENKYSEFMKLFKQLKEMEN